MKTVSVRDLHGGRVRPREIKFTVGVVFLRPSKWRRRLEGPTQLPATSDLTRTRMQWGTNQETQKGTALFGRFPFASKWLPESDAGQNHFPLLFEFPFGLLNATKGAKLLLPADEAVARREARVRKPKPPSAQIFLMQALDFQARLQADKSLKRAALARQAGISPTRITQILRLLRLSPEIRKAVLALEPAIGRGLTEKCLRAVALEPDHASQARRLRALLGQAR